MCLQLPQSDLLVPGSGSTADKQKLQARCPWSQSAQHKLPGLWAHPALAGEGDKKCSHWFEMTQYHGMPRIAHSDARETGKWSGGGGHCASPTTHTSPNMGTCCSDPCREASPVLPGLVFQGKREFRVLCESDGQPIHSK